MAYKRERDELIHELREQVAFLRRSSESFDEGYEGEGRRLATVIRVLLHDRGRSRSLLEQLDVKNDMQFLDTAIPINPNNLLPTPGLLMMQFDSGPEGGGGRYVPRLEDGSPRTVGQAPLSFSSWWGRPVAKDGRGEEFSRCDFVLTVANKDGGAHVDPSLDMSYAALTRDNSMGWVYSSDSSEAEVRLGGNVAFASVRQIAFEVEQSLQRDLMHFIDPEAQGLGRLATQMVGRNDPCPCESGLKYKKCHGK